MKPAQASDAAFRMAVVVAAVVSLHVFGLAWLQSLLPVPQPLVAMKDPLFTRLLAPAAPPVIPQAQGPAAQHPAPPKVRRNVLAAVQIDRSALPQTGAPDPAADLTAQALQMPPPTPSPTPNTAIIALSSPSTESAAPDSAHEPPPPTRVAAEANPPPLQETKPPTAASPLLADLPRDSWPPDTRLSYNLSGFFRGDLHGSARVQWQREAPMGLAHDQAPLRYQVRFDLGATGITLMSMTSQGEVTASSLMPKVYEENLPNGLRRATFGGGYVKFQDGSQAEMPPQVQDTASQFVELSHRFSTGRARLAVGGVISIWLARPGGMDLWIYDIVEEETLHTPNLGAVQAFRLRPRPLANPRGPIAAELWFAPSLQFLPVRVRIALGGANFVDLMVDRIEQSATAPQAPQVPSVSPPSASSGPH